MLRWGKYRVTISYKHEPRIFEGSMIGDDDDWILVSSAPRKHWIRWDEFLGLVMKQALRNGGLVDIHTEPGAPLCTREFLERFVPVNISNIHLGMRRKGDFAENH